ncbi:MAG: hypothetical protein AAF385_17555 [Pseudomonadota bacterium]
MAQLHQLLLVTHISVGALALLILWIPALSRKGSPLHIRSGRWYVWAMYTVSISAFVMCILSLADPIGVRFGDREFSAERAADIAAQLRRFSLFLLLLSILVFASLRHGILVLKVRANREQLRTPLHIALMTSLVVAAIAVGIVGLMAGQTLLIAFSLVGLFGGVGMFRYSFKKEISRKEWVIEHLGSLIGSAIGANTAFFVFGGSRYLGEVFSGQWMLIPWLAPAVIGTVIIAVLSRRYRKRFAPRTAKAQ